MLLKIEDAKYFKKYLIPNNDNTYMAVNLENITEEERKWLINYDETYFLCEEIHIIANYKDLINEK